ncbi:60S ribosomal export protein nmd3 [Thraustotheca clavata]|uniref:60S ribosomal export protein NMD3 n=1 Tax=Thraustotheca clavata TaxID=74557 RepID=A0A1V9Y7X0_9STRA|nr:60S ribosomal export protein nmd3 [Thraustotheca clavata]
MTILCCMCGVAIEPNLANMCVSCLSNEVDVTEGITKEGILIQCRGCLRFQKGVKGGGGPFLDCPLESLELMSLCLKKIQGLNRDVKLIDASFIWTEPHSKRIKLKLTIRKEAMRNAMVQKSFVVTFVVENLKCPDCSKQYHNNTWKALVQIRQKVPHKRTFLHLEQIILKHSAHTRSIGMASEKDGMDFYFGEKNSAERFTQFLSQHVPMRSKMARKLVSTDNHNNTANVKLTIVAEIAPLCKDDLVILDKRMANQCGMTIALISRVTTQIHLIDPRTCRRSEIISERYWKNPFSALDTSSSMVEFIVLDVEPLNATPFGETETVSDDILAVVEVARVSDFGFNDTTFHVTTHLGKYLSAGDTVKGYDLSVCNFGSSATYYLKEELPDIILVRRVFPKKEKDGKGQERKKIRWQQKLKESQKEREREEEEFEAFMDDYEEDHANDEIPVMNLLDMNDEVVDELEIDENAAEIDEDTDEIETKPLVVES